MQSKTWLDKYSHRKLAGGLILIAIGLAQMAEFTADPAVHKDVTGDTLVSGAFAQINGDTTFVIAVLDQKLEPGNQMPVIDLSEISSEITGMVPVTSFFATGDGRQYLSFGASPNKFDATFIQRVGEFLATRAGDHINAKKQIADVRLIGDTYATMLLENDIAIALNNIVVLGYVPTQNLLVSRHRGSGRLLYQSVAMLQRYGVDTFETWQRVQVDSDDVFRVGRLVADANDIVAPITATRGGTEEVNGQIVINLASGVAHVEYNDDPWFVVTTTRISDARRATDDRDPLGLITFANQSLGMKPTTASATVGSYERYTRAAQQMQLTA